MTARGEMRAPVLADVDSRLRAGCGRIELGLVIADHDTPPGACCPRCFWPVGGPHRSCPSRALASAIRARRPVPAWLVHLVGQVPGAIAPPVPVDLAAVHAAQDALPGLFDPPPRQRRGAPAATGLPSKSPDSSNPLTGTRTVEGHRS